MGGHDDPMAADRRTLVIAAVAMVALIAIGVVSSALFTASACEAIEPAPVEPTGYGTAVDGALEQAFSDLDQPGRDRMAATVESLSGQLGSVSAVHVLPDVAGLAATGIGVVATGPTTAVVDGVGPATAVDVGEAAVVGDGAALYGLALENPLTGQVDALQPVATGTAEGGALEGLTCQDTATVGTPLAFHLGAGGGELALLRADEDGEDAILELRDPVDGRVWAAPLELGRAPAGVQGARLTAGLGDDVVVTGYRADPDAAGLPVLAGFDRADGAARWTLTRDHLDAAVSDDRPDRIEVVAVGSELAVVEVQAEDLDAPRDPAATEPATTGPRTLVGVDPATGELRFVEELADGTDLADVLVDGRRALVAFGVDDGTRVVELGEQADGVPHELAVADARLARSDDGTVVVVGDRGVSLLADGRVDTVASEQPATAVLADEDTTTIVFGEPDGGGVVVVVFGG